MKLTGNKLTKVKTCIATVAGSATMVAMIVMPAYAGSGVAEIDNGINVIKAIGIALVSGAGVIALIKGAMDLFTGITQRDQASTKDGALEVFAGIGMAAIGTVIGLLV